MASFGELDQGRSPNIGVKISQKFPGDPGIQILAKKNPVLSNKTLYDIVLERTAKIANKLKKASK